MWLTKKEYEKIKYENIVLSEELDLMKLSYCIIIRKIDELEKQLNKVLEKDNNLLSLHNN